MSAVRSGVALADWELQMQIRPPPSPALVLQGSAAWVGREAALRSSEYGSCSGFCETWLCNLPEALQCRPWARSTELGTWDKSFEGLLLAKLISDFDILNVFLGSSMWRTCFFLHEFNLVTHMEWLSYSNIMKRRLPNISKANSCGCRFDNGLFLHQSAHAYRGHSPHRFCMLKLSCRFTSRCFDTRILM